MHNLPLALTNGVERPDDDETETPRKLPRTSASPLRLTESPHPSGGSLAPAAASTPSTPAVPASAKAASLDFHMSSCAAEIPGPPPLPIAEPSSPLRLPTSPDSGMSEMLEEMMMIAEATEMPSSESAEETQQAGGCVLIVAWNVTV